MTRLNEDQAAALLYDLCVILGFCLQRADHDRIKRNPPEKIEEFINAVYEAEGTDETTNERCRRQMRKIVQEHFSRC
jgi:hypothetical protein